jgi:tRNA (cytidine/uridine-2'-O-)-methyltransferase
VTRPEPTQSIPATPGSPRALFHVVLHEPEIPNNTGNIGRTCVAAGCALHLIEPLGFDVSEKACRRAGLDYWPRLGVRRYESFDDYLAREQPSRLWLLSTKGTRSVFDADFRRGDTLLFGKETRGLPEAILARYPDKILTLPMVEGERSLNLATAVCAVVYEGVRKLLVSGEAMTTPDGRLVP